MSPNERKSTMKMPWPKASKEEKIDGWIISVSLLREIQEGIRKHDDIARPPCQMEIESVLLALVRMNLAPHKKQTTTERRK